MISTRSAIGLLGLGRGLGFGRVVGFGGLVAGIVVSEKAVSVRLVLRIGLTLKGKLTAALERSIR